jgi:hypothetical protein
VVRFLHKTFSPLRRGELHFAGPRFISVDSRVSFSVETPIAAAAVSGALSFAPGNRRLYIWQINLGDYRCIKWEE